MEAKERDGYFKANNAEELLFALKNKESYILIQEEFKTEFVQSTQQPLSDTEEMGFHLGFNGWGSIWGSLFFHIVNFFSKGSKQQKKIDSKIRNYSLKHLNEREMLLYLRQLDY
ncbi:hypothetical protein [Shouchella shacheensis]|uniref:hypothetical protein n=1 Tax=Shouchella shacheensis TaxID=1649580 RepID=UPI00073FE7DD|nr:hypothetical protein [Shouchella shacheensis]